jgi:hypothetical protein
MAFPKEITNYSDVQEVLFCYVIQRFIITTKIHHLIISEVSSIQFTSSQLISIKHGLDDVRHTEMHTAKAAGTESNFVEAEITTEELRR